jgi:hypothetical protein
MSAGDHIRPCADTSEMSWVAPDLRPFADGIGSLVPRVFEAYARLLHPAEGERDSPIRWSAVAAWSGGVVHALAEFEPMARPRGPAPSARPYVKPPADGRLAPATLAALCDVLADHTTTPDQCYFGVWEGYGWIPQAARSAARLELPERTHLMFRGPLSRVADIGSHLGGWFRQESPSIIFPADRSWFTATDVDLDSTFVGGSRDLIGALLGDDRLEAWPASPTDPITAASDRINRS